ncbi:prepilin peptidase [Pseudalkalibacillus hwajinpoensis]|uniref:prepilin peptidase n=1 Tax=Guptibacillus hwajinpoensis TaxID=208199 RepID=UPI00325BC490
MGIIYSYLFLSGLVMGSFFNVVGLRVPKKLSIVRPRSSCPRCKRNLGPLELIPVVSFLFQKGKCKGCLSKISPIYAVIEFITAFLFMITPHLIGWSHELLVAYGLLSLLIIVSISDFVYMIIPDKVLLFFGGYFILVRVIVPLDLWYSPFLGAAVGFIFLLLIAIISKGGMGGGDIKLFAVLGLVFGYQQLLLVFFFSTLCGTIIGLGALLTGKVKRKQPVPFGPSIAIGSLITYYFSSRILEWYVNLL